MKAAVRLLKLRPSPIWPRQSPLRLRGRGWRGLFASGLEGQLRSLDVARMSFGCGLFHLFTRFIFHCMLGV